MKTKGLINKIYYYSLIKPPTILKLGLFLFLFSEEWRCFNKTIIWQVNEYITKLCLPL